MGLPRERFSLHRRKETKKALGKSALPPTAISMVAQLDIGLWAVL